LPRSIHDRIAVSSWSLHRLLGTTYPHDLSSDAVGPEEATFSEGTESLLGLPSALARHGIGRLELVSFHLRSRDPFIWESCGQAWRRPRCGCKRC